MFFQSIKYCSNCGNNVVFSLIEGEDRKRYYCENCKTVHYTNPKLVVGALVYFEDKILLCKTVEILSARCLASSAFSPSYNSFTVVRNKAFHLSK